MAILSSCSKEHPGCFTNIGEEQARKNKEAFIDAIIVHDQLDVLLIPDSLQEGLIVIEGPENVIPNIGLSWDNGRLVIDDNNPCRWFRKYGRLLIKVHIKDLKLIEVYDNAAVHSNDSLPLINCKFNMYSVRDQSLILNAETFEIHHHDAGTINLSGYCAVFIPTIYETGMLNSFQMQSDFAFVFHYGLNKARVHPFKELEVVIENSGNIYYDQKPILPITQTGRGEGQLIYQP